MDSIVQRAPATDAAGGQSRPVRVALAARHDLLRRGVARAFDQDPLLEIVHEGDSLAATVAVASRTEPDIVLVDSSACDGGARGQLRALRARRPGTAVVLLVAPGRDRVQPQLRRAATAAIVRTVEPVALLDALRRIAAGEPQPEPPERASRSGHRPPLSEREQQVLTALACGLTNRAIARELWLSEHTVKFHISRIYRKLGLRSRAEAVRWLSENGVVPADAPAVGEAP